MISSGMSTLEEVDDAVQIIKSHHNEVVLMHCNSTYPSPEDELNLKVIQSFKKRYDFTIGYSGHEYSVEPTVIAAILGAEYIERHVTLDHDMWGTDQNSSLEIDGMDRLIRRLKSLEKIMGDGIKKLSTSEMEVKKRLRG